MHLPCKGLSRVQYSVASFRMADAAVVGVYSPLSSICGGRSLNKESRATLNTTFFVVHHESVDEAVTLVSGDNGKALTEDSLLGEDCVDEGDCGREEALRLSVSQPSNIKPLTDVDANVREAS